MRRSLFVFSILIFVTALALAQDSAVTRLDVAQHDEFGSHLVNESGMSVYMFQNDEEMSSACYDECAENWPPVTTEGEPIAGSGVAASLIGTFEREDGSTQVTYHSMPLYTYVGDEAAGDANGHGAGDVWFLVSPYGSPVAVPEEEDEDDASAENDTEKMDPMARANLMGEGRTVFDANCAECHGASGGGVTAPALADNARLSNSERVIAQVLRGGSHMPGFGSALTDREVAAVVTYIRESWGNSFGVVTLEEVSAER